MKTWSVAATSIPLTLLLTACVTTDAHRDGRERGAGLTGPWAAEFEQALRASDSEAERAVLEDGVVTNVELQQAHQAMQACLSDAGLRIVYADEGGFELESVDGDYGDGFADRADRVLRDCESDHDRYVTYLYEQTRRNPAHEDEGAITVACLIREELVDDSYTRERWLLDSEDGEYPFDDSSAPARRCAIDPLGLWYER